MQELINIIERRLNEQDLVNGKNRIAGLSSFIEDVENINDKAIEEVYNYIIKLLLRVNDDDQFKFLDLVQGLISHYFSKQSDLINESVIFYLTIQQEVDMYKIVEGRLISKLREFEKSLVNGLNLSGSKTKVLKYSKEERRQFYLNISKNIGLFEEPKMADDFAEFMSEPHGLHTKYSLRLRCSNRDFHYVLTTIHNKDSEFKFEKKHLFNQLFIYGKNGKILNEHQFQKVPHQPKNAKEFLGNIEKCFELLKKD